MSTHSLSNSGDNKVVHGNFRSRCQDGGALPYFGACASSFSSHTTVLNHDPSSYVFDGMQTVEENNYSIFSDKLDTPITEYSSDTSEVKPLFTSRIEPEIQPTDTNGAHRSSSEPDLIYDVVNGFDRYSNYLPVIVGQTIQCESSKEFDHPVNKLGSQLNIKAWQHELSFENDANLRDYISFGVTNGFLIIDENADVPSYECPNYSSVLHGEAFHSVNKTVSNELANGKYILAKEKPHCVHGLGAVPKKESGKWRVITDCKRPLGSSINCFMSDTFREFCYSSVDSVIAMIEPNMYMSSVDIASAYRSLLVHPTQWKYQGISWPLEGQNTYMLDTHICFGLRCAPYLFTQVTNFVKRCMQRRGFEGISVYLDDFIVTGRTFDECLHAQQSLIQLLRTLGFYIAWDKCSPPGQEITYLGVVLNSKEMSVSLPSSKMCKLQNELQFFCNKKRATKKQVQRLCGILCHCSKVVKGGRTFSHRIISLLRGWPDTTKRIRLSQEFQHDIAWWKHFAQDFNGKNLMIEFNFGQGPSFFTDSCIAGYGFWCQQDWQAGYFNSALIPISSYADPIHGHWVNVHITDISASENIAVLELIPIWLGLLRCAKQWRDLHVLCHTDNQSVMFMINKGCSNNLLCMVLLRDIFWICAKENIHLTARHIRGDLNVLADALSRVFFTNDLRFLYEFSLCCSERFPSESCGHVASGSSTGPYCTSCMGGEHVENEKLPVETFHRLL